MTFHCFDTAAGAKTARKRLDGYLTDVSGIRREVWDAALPAVEANPLTH